MGLLRALSGLALVLGLTQGSRFDPNSVKPLGLPPPDFYDATQLISYYGYRPEPHKVITEDGYILPLIRISNEPGTPVLLVMGKGGGPELWLIRGPGHDLGFILSDMGYDIWLGVKRGEEGTSHKYLSRSQPQFWNFSFDEMGYYDIPAMTDYILSVTNQSKILYGGDCMGSTLFAVMCSERSSYNDLFLGSFHFAPAIWMPACLELPSSQRITLKIAHIILKTARNLGVNSVRLMPTYYHQAFIKYFCDLPVFKNICTFLFVLLAEYSEQTMASGWFGYTLAETGSGISLRTTEHFLLLSLGEGGIKKYDWGPEKNLIAYGSVTPPSYDLSKMTSPTAVYYSIKDNLVTHSAMKKALALIGNLNHSMAISDPDYGHVEFVYGKDMNKLIYSDLVDFLDRISELNDDT